MAESIIMYNSMADFYAAIGGTMEQGLDFTIHRLEEAHPIAPFASPLFRANYYTIVFIRRGCGHYRVDQYSYHTQPYTIYFTNPGHLKAFEIVDVSSGYLVTFAESFLKQHVHREIFTIFPFLLAEIAPPQYTERETFQIFDRLGEQLILEFQSVSPYKAQILGGFMRVLLYKIKELFWSNYNPLAATDSGSMIVSTFKQHLETYIRELVAGNGRKMLQVRDFAAAQQLHPNYFSAVIKSKTGKTVQVWIAEKIIAEAQALLSTGHISVQEIAYHLGFTEPGHFARFFKKHTGTTPSVFRERLSSVGAAGPTHSSHGV